MGFDDRRLTLAGESTPGAGAPAGVVVEVLQRVLRPYVPSVEIVPTGVGPGSVPAVRERRCELGVVRYEQLLAASGAGEAHDHDELAVVANVNHPAWLAVAVRPELGVDDLAEITARRLPARVRGTTGGVPGLLLEHYGLSAAALEAQGGSLAPPVERGEAARNTWARTGEFDVIVDMIFTGYAPTSRHFHDASARFELRWLPVPDEVARAAGRAGIGEWSVMPAHVVGGQGAPVPSVSRHPLAVYGRADMPEGFARLVAQGLDENRALLRASALALSYDPLNVAMSYGIDLHPGARRYYNQMRYPVGAAAEDHDHGEGEDHHHGPGEEHGHHHTHEHPHEEQWSHLAAEHGHHGHEHPSGSDHDHDHDHDDDRAHEEVAAADAWKAGFGQRA